MKLIYQLSSRDDEYKRAVIELNRIGMNREGYN